MSYVWYVCVLFTVLSETHRHNFCKVLWRSRWLFAHCNQGSKSYHSVGEFYILNCLVLFSQNPTDSLFSYSRNLKQCISNNVTKWNSSKLRKTPTCDGSQQIMRRQQFFTLFPQEYLSFHEECPTDKRNSYRLRNPMWRIPVLHIISYRVVKSYQLPSIFLKKWTVPSVEGKRSEMYKWGNTLEVKRTRGWMYMSGCYKKWALQ